MKCKECGKEFEQQSHERFCPSCRVEYGQEQRVSPGSRYRLGRDRYTERLKDGFELLGMSGDGDE